MNENAETKKRIRNILEKLSETQKETKQILEEYYNKKIYLKVHSQSMLEVIDIMIQTMINQYNKKREV